MLLNHIKSKDLFSNYSDEKGESGFSSQNSLLQNSENDNYSQDFLSEQYPSQVAVSIIVLCTVIIVIIVIIVAAVVITSVIISIVNVVVIIIIITMIIIVVFTSVIIIIIVIIISMRMYQKYMCEPPLYKASSQIELSNKTIPVCNPLEHNRMKPKNQDDRYL
uniref:Uncharacterized protein n=1 Tax=Octopus bimaculoides TaxID=37653 RepID=A0A0L8H4M4_OCTBM